VKNTTQKGIKLDINKNECIKSCKDRYKDGW
jgi:hypothetical protein